MILALDADVLVNWMVPSTDRHRDVSVLLAAQRRGESPCIALVPQVLFEFIHVVTDPRRFSQPLSIEQATLRADDLWSAPDVRQVLPARSVPARVGELLRQHGLGRKRVLDTALAATLEAAGIRRLATLNGRDFQIFDFLEVVEPGA